MLPTAPHPVCDDALLLGCRWCWRAFPLVTPTSGTWASQTRQQALGWGGQIWRPARWMRCLPRANPVCCSGACPASARQRLRATSQTWTIHSTAMLLAAGGTMCSGSHGGRPAQVRGLCLACAACREDVIGITCCSSYTRTALMAAKVQVRQCTQRPSASWSSCSSVHLQACRQPHAWLIGWAEKRCWWSWTTCGMQGEGRDSLGQ